MIRPLLATAALGLAVPASAATPIAGRYLTEDGAGIIEVGRCGNSVCGRLVRIVKSQPDAPKTDVNNSDPALRSRSILGMPILSGFTDAGSDWRGRDLRPAQRQDL
ncbi:DUF2147 domain-containing protein [Sphingomonas hankookensis]|uniref:DUF2147 domain-containing protein n=1 Tax=Sphingomonas hankookensis TaxID=563996 RepID=UPI003D3024AA